ncbi:MAG: 3-hydroxyanthranilate 3,4-dioxygenase [Acidimicrobiales bacterium]
MAAPQPPTSPIDITAWIAEHADDFRPPVSNKVVWRNSDFITMVIGGPNARTDFHIDPGDEIFHQIIGTMRLDLVIDGERTTRLLGPGEMLLVPGGVPHSPRRPGGSFGLVIERVRAPDELDALRWYCESCDAVVHEVSFHVDDIETELSRHIGDFHGSVERRTCPRCGTVVPVPEPFVLDL